MPDDVWERLEVQEFDLGDNAHCSAEGRQAGDQSEVGESPLAVACVKLAKEVAPVEEEG